LVEAEKQMMDHPEISSASGTLDFTQKKVVFISSEGSWVEQIHYRTGGWVSGEIWDGNEKIKRSWPGPTGMFRAQGYETIEGFRFEEETKRLISELKELKRAPEMPSGTFDLILKGSILALQIHETFGHASESDRIFGYEDNFGGRTFLNPGLINGAPVASSIVHLFSDSRVPGTGSFAFDDEGTKTKRMDILKKGIFQNYLTSRETAYFLNQKSSSANMIAEDWSHYPLIRMSNLSLLPGKGTLNEMIRNTKGGVMLDNELSWSIDEMRLDFQIGGEMGIRIKNGKVTGLVRFPIYHGNTIDFWRDCDAIAGPKEWRFWGFSDCGKGGPYQEAFTGHGLSPARFRNIRFGRK
jgi:TldD protein